MKVHCWPPDPHVVPSPPHQKLTTPEYPAQSLCQACYSAMWLQAEMSLSPTPHIPIKVYFNKELQETIIILSE